MADRHPSIFPGQQINWLTVIAEVPRRKGRRRWLCECRCGVRKEIDQSNLRSYLSCGCWQTIHPNHVTHGYGRIPEYAVWNTMRQRCENPKVSYFANYGGRGIKVCERWHSFVHFYEDMGPRPSSSHTIERRDNDGDYEPDNCHWATRLEQGRNKRNSHLLTFNGETMSVSAWAERMKMPAPRLYARIRVLGWSVERALLT